MRRILWVAGALCLTLLGAPVQAQELSVSGTGATGVPGQRVYVQLSYDYPPGFEVIAEDFKFEYEFAGLTWLPDSSRIGPPGASGAPDTRPSFVDYTNDLRALAQGSFGGMLINSSPITSAPQLKGYAYSFYTLTASHTRGGPVHLDLAFDIPVSAAPDDYVVAFAGSMLADVEGNEFAYPMALQSPGLIVSVVPEPYIAWMLLPGLVLVGLRARRRTASPR